MYLFLCLVFLVFSCKTFNLPNDLTEMQIAQRGQQAVDKGDYKSAKYIYNELVNRYGDNISTRIAAEFELAHIDVKCRRWEDAEEKLEQVLDYYNQYGFGLPNEYRKLAEIDLETVREKNKSKKESKSKKTENISENVSITPNVSKSENPAFLERN